MYNKKSIQDGIILYKKLFDYLLNNEYSGIQELINISSFKENTNLSTNWVITNIYENLYEFFENQEFINATSGLKKLNDTNCFILQGTINEVKKIKHILSYFNDIFYSINMNNLYNVFFNYYDTLDKYDEKYFKNKLEGGKGKSKHLFSLQKLAIEIKDIINNSLIDKNKYIEVLQLLYDALCDVDINAFSKIDENVYHIFPIDGNELLEYNMSNEIINENEIKLYSINELYLDTCDDNELNEIDMELANFTTYKYENGIDFCGQKKTQKANLGGENTQEIYSHILNRNFLLKDEHKKLLKEWTKTNVAEDLNRKFGLFAHSNINIQDDCIQNLALRLVNWMNENSEKNILNEYFPNFIREEERNKLRSDKVMAEISMNYGKISKVLRENKFKDFNDLIEEYRKLKSDTNNLSNDRFSDVVPDEFYDSDIEKEEFAKSIGEIGEKYAFEIMRTYVENMKKENPMNDIKLINKNDEKYKNAGYEFEIISYDKKLLDEDGFNENNIDDERIKRTFVEVKAHEKNARLKNHLKLSGEQYNLAIRKGDEYIILKVSIDSHSTKDIDIWELANYKIYKNLLNCEKAGEIIPKEYLYLSKGDI